jgi:predicted ArsR family transcriptional regulator
MHQDARARARDRVLFQLKTRGPATAAQLGKRLGVTPMAVRQHLAALHEEELVDFEDERRKVGRPARVWSIAPAAAARFPDSHADLTVDLIESVRRTLGEDALSKVISARTRRQAAIYRDQMPSDVSLDKRVAALTALRREEGYMAEWSRQRDGSLLLIENHCPICAAATVCQGLCAEELGLFRSVIGSDAIIEREEHVLAEGRRCTYRITPRTAARKRAARTARKS